MCAWLRRPADDSMAALLQPKRRRHALATSFAILDARTYSEIANVQVRSRHTYGCVRCMLSRSYSVVCYMASQLSVVYVLSQCCHKY